MHEIIFYYTKQGKRIMVVRAVDTDSEIGEMQK